MGYGMIGVVWLFLVAVVAMQGSGAEVFSAKLMHRFSEEVNAVRVSRLGGDANAVGLPQKWSSEYYRRLLSSDVERQKMKLGPQSQYLFPSRGSRVQQLGNDFGWLHYTWIDVGSPNVSFLVALDTGSDLLWLPCDCMQCAPLSAIHYSSLDKDLKEYNPSGSTTSKFVNCSHQLCELGQECKSPNQHCPYTVNYDTDDTSTSGFLVEDILHLVSGNHKKSNKFVQAPVVIGCGSKQSGIYLTGVAPDGLMGLGLGKISVPSFLAEAGISENSFSLCFKEDGEGRIYFGDQGIANQSLTPFLSADDIKAYVIGVEAFCVETSCLEQTNIKVLVDSGTSFTFLPNSAYQKLVGEFHRQINITKSSFEGYPWEYCYKPSLTLPKIPSIFLKFDANNSFEVLNPVFEVYSSQGPIGFCLAIQPTDGDVGTVGQNFMTGYRMVFDGANMKLGWSPSDCQDLIDKKTFPVTPSDGGSPISLPSVEQQSAPTNHAVPSTLAGTTPSKSSATSILVIPRQLCISECLLPFWLTASMFLWAF